jgi:hypothetical protein
MAAGFISYWFIRATLQLYQTDPAGRAGRLLAVVHVGGAERPDALANGARRANSQGKDFCPG